MLQGLIKDFPIELKNLQEKILILKREGKINIQNGDIGYASAPSNIALLKYWGKVEKRVQIPVNSSISYTLGGFRSFTKVTALGRFFPTEQVQTINPFSNKLFLNGNLDNEIPAKMDSLIKSILYPFAQEISLKIESKNNFPTACGIASSASGYAALVAAIADLLQLRNHFSDAELILWLTEWARLGSGSATRSCFVSSEVSFIKWESPLDYENGYPVTSALKSHTDWGQLQHCIFILDSNKKEILSSDGHKFADTSPLQSIRVAGIPLRIEMMEKALNEFDFLMMQMLVEEDAYSMHAVMCSGTPKVCYLTADVVKFISLFVKFRNQNKIKAIWTLDAGSNIHILFMPNELQRIKEFHKKIEDILNSKISLLVNQSKEGLVIGRDDYEKIASQNLLLKNL